MPRIHTRTFRIRYYECDNFGHLNNANYLRFMQETAFDASAAAGYDIERYNQIGYHWLIRETDIEYLRPINYGESVEVKTWVMDFYRVRSRRAYEFYIQGSQELVARANTDWIYINSKTNQPTTIPDEMALSFFPEGLPDSYPPRHFFSSAPPPPDGAFTMNRRVIWQDIDTAGHVNNAAYLNMIEECGMQVIAAHGWPVTRMITEGFAILLRRNQILYLRPAFLDDELLITTWVSNVRRSTATRHYRVTRLSDNAHIATVHSLGVWVELASGRPIRIPQKLLEDFAPNIVSTESTATQSS